MFFISIIISCRSSITAFLHFFFSSYIFYKIFRFVMVCSHLSQFGYIEIGKAYEMKFMKIMHLVHRIKTIACNIVLTILSACGAVVISLISFVVDLIFRRYRDLSHNSLTTIGRKTFKGATSLRSLQLDNNEITCLDEQAFRGLTELEIL